MTREGSKAPGGGEESAGFAAGPRAAEGADAVTGARGGVGEGFLPIQRRACCSGEQHGGGRGWECGGGRVEI